MISIILIIDDLTVIFRSLKDLSIFYLVVHDNRDILGRYGLHDVFSNVPKDLIRYVSHLVLVEDLSILNLFYFL